MIKDQEVRYAKIHLSFDSRKKGEKQLQVIEGDEETICALIGATLRQLLESGFDRELLEHAIDESLCRNKKKKVEIKKFQLSDDDAKNFEELLKKITGED